jgi:hypothetical protein
MAELEDNVVSYNTAQQGCPTKTTRQINETPEGI